MSGNVFMSYGQDNLSRKELALNFAQKLRSSGVNITIDQFVPHPKQGWPKWMEEQLRKSDVLLVAPSPKFQESFNQEGRPNGGRFEGSLISTKLLENGVSYEKTAVVLLDADDKQHIPDLLKSCSYYKVYEDAGYESLYRWITEQPEILPVALGKLIELKPRTWSKSEQGSKVLSSFKDLCEAIFPLLNENGRIFRSFAPNSGAGATGELRTDFAIWEEMKKNTLVPNNAQIKILIQTNYRVIPEKFTADFDAWLSHIDAFSVHVKNGGAHYRDHQFPTTVEEIVKISIQNDSISTT